MLRAGHSEIKAVRKVPNEESYQLFLGCLHIPVHVCGVSGLLGLWRQDPNQPADQDWRLWLFQPILADRRWQHVCHVTHGGRLPGQHLLFAKKKFQP